MSVAAARDVAARLDFREPRPCKMRCSGESGAVRLDLEEERDYRLVLIAKAVGPRDEFHVHNIHRDTKLVLVENADIGSVLSLHGTDALKVCSRTNAPTLGCDWTCSIDSDTDVVKMNTPELSAEFAVICY